MLLNISAESGSSLHTFELEGGGLCVETRKAAGAMVLDTPFQETMKRFDRLQRRRANG